MPIIHEVDDVQLDVISLRTIPMKQEENDNTFSNIDDDHYQHRLFQPVDSALILVSSFQ